MNKTILFSRPKMAVFKKKNLQGKICLSPFVSIEVGISGNVRLCNCAAWMPSTVGNLFEQSLQEILSNVHSLAIRQSIIDGTYEYCNENTCGIMLHNMLNSQDNIPKPIQSLLQNAANFQMPNEIVIGGDATCNLSCPSCRTRVIKNSEEQADRNIEMGLRLMSNLFSTPTDKPIKLYVSTAGELFASPLLMSFVKNIPVQDFPNLELCIQTNGLMVAQNWHKLGEIQNRVTLMTVTTDAACADTYEKLRRGGRWQDIQQALAWIAEKKRNNGMQLRLRMVAQHDNFSEMLEFYNQARDLGADKVEYGRLLNMQTYSPDEFQHHDVFDPTHPRYREAMSALDQVRDLPDVFFYGGLT